MTCLVFGILCAIISALAIKIYLLRKGLMEIDRCLEDILSRDTNRQITLSSRDRSVCRVASRLNVHLAQLRKSQLKYTNGDRELKEAITNISHDLRTPLTAVSGYLELLERKYHSGEILSCPRNAMSYGETGACPDNAMSYGKTGACSGNAMSYGKSDACSDNSMSSGETGACPDSKMYPGNSRSEVSSTEVLRCLEIIRNRTEHMKQLTDELFQYSLALSVPREKPRLLAINRILEECLLSFYESLYKKGITPIVSIPEDPVIRTLDPAALSRIFQNILGNAVKYSGGDLEVCLTADGTVTCSNTAPNLNPLLAEQLFDRYYTVETVSSPGSESSTGLGLSIARLLTEQMGGEISASCIQQSDSGSQSSVPTNRLKITIRFPA